MATSPSAPGDRWWRHDEFNAVGNSLPTAVESFAYQDWDDYKPDQFRYYLARNEAGEVYKVAVDVVVSLRAATVGRVL